MKKIINHIGVIMLLTVLLAACDTHPSLQKYFVDSKENENFMAVDIPSSILQLKDTETSQEVKDVLETIHKINFLGLQIKEDNEELYKDERGKVKEILKNPKYKQLMRFNQGNASVSVNYLGKEDAIDEVIIFGADNEKGFAIVRVIGENMNPSEILKIAQEINLDNNSEQMKQLSGLLGNIY